MVRPLASLLVREPLLDAQPCFEQRNNSSSFFLFLCFLLFFWWIGFMMPQSGSNKSSPACFFFFHCLVYSFREEPWQVPLTIYPCILHERQRKCSRLSAACLKSLLPITEAHGFCYSRLDVEESSDGWM